MIDSRPEINKCQEEMYSGGPAPLDKFCNRPSKYFEDGKSYCGLHAPSVKHRKLLKMRLPYCSKCKRPYDDRPR